MFDKEKFKEELNKFYDEKNKFNKKLIRAMVDSVDEEIPDYLIKLVEHLLESYDWDYEAVYYEIDNYLKIINEAVKYHCGSST